MRRPRTINHAIQDIKAGDWVIRRKMFGGNYVSEPAEVGRLTPTQIHIYYPSRLGTDIYHRTDGQPLAGCRGYIIRPATRAEVEAHKADKQRQQEQVAARQRLQEAADAHRAALNALLPHGVYLQGGNNGKWDIVISDCTDAQVREVAEVLKRVSR